MKKDFDTYTDALAEAQKLADGTLGIIDSFVARPTPHQGWTIGFLPAKENRRGWELKVQVVRCSTWTDAMERNS